MINKNSSGFCYVVLYPIAKPDKFYFFGNDYLFYLFLLLKITLFTVQYWSKVKWCCLFWSNLYALILWMHEWTKEWMHACTPAWMKQAVSPPHSVIRRRRVVVCVRVDMRLERNRLWKTAVPQLKHYCAEQLLTFLLIDLPWDLHHLSMHQSLSSATAAAGSAAVWNRSLRVTELVRCHRQSVGTEFVVHITMNIT